MASTVTGEFDMTSIDHGNALHMRRTCAAELAIAGSPRFGMYVAGAISFSAFRRTSYRTCVESDARIGCSVGYLAEWNPACGTIVSSVVGAGRGEGSVAHRHQGSEAPTRAGPKTRETPAAAGGTRTLPAPMDSRPSGSCCCSF